ncbi:MAG TPA: rod shape-determining protein MreC [Flavobacteriales bacterium]|nr:rod shape-determining protein MreC [Flavobacteriales bacterium]
MKHLRFFIVKNYFFLLFLVLQVAAITMLASSSNYHKKTLFNSSNAVIGYILEKKSQVSQFLNLRQTNNQLLEENARLRTLIKSSHYRVQNGVIQLGDSLYKKQFDFLPAHVISGTVNKRNNYFTIDRGTLNGVEVGMGVISNGCMVGFVKDASEHYATVLTVLHDKFIQSVRMPRNNEHGSVFWDGRDPNLLDLKGIPLDANVRGGDSVLTRGTSGRFPNDIFVGTVYSVAVKQGSGHHYIKLKLGIDLNAVYTVMLVRNKFADEIKKLEDAVEYGKHSRK